MSGVASLLRDFVKVALVLAFGESAPPISRLTKRLISKMSVPNPTVIPPKTRSGSAYSPGAAMAASASAVTLDTTSVEAPGSVRRLGSAMKVILVRLGVARIAGAIDERT